MSIGTGNNVLCRSTLEKCVIDALVAKLCVIVCIDLSEKINGLEVVVLLHGNNQLMSLRC